MAGKYKFKGYFRKFSVGYLAVTSSREMNLRRNDKGFHEAGDLLYLFSQQKMNILKFKPDHPILITGFRYQLRSVDICIFASSVKTIETPFHFISSFFIATLKLDAVLIKFL